MRISDEQVRAHRLRRHGLVSPFPDPFATVAAVLGIQAQVEPPALWSIALRTRGTPAAESLRHLLMEPPRPLVRVWSFRDTLHVHTTTDWPLLAAVDPLLTSSGRKGAIPPDAVLRKADALAAKLRRPVTRQDLMPLVTPQMLAEMSARVGPDQALRAAAGRIPWVLVHGGRWCAGPKVGSEQGYVRRVDWVPEVTDSPLSAEKAAVEVTRRALAANGPATPADLAHFLGCRVTEVRRWLASLSDETVEVTAGDRRLLCLAAHADELARPAEFGEPRLLAAYDTLLMSHADKHWTVPDADERPRVWAKAGVVSASVLHEGRIVATWSQEKKGRTTVVTVQPMSGWKAGLLRRLRPDAEALASHLGLDGASLTVAG